MACPWQTDTSSCLSAYRPYGGEYLPTFWPARVPNDVLTQGNYDILIDPSTTPAEKEEAFNAVAAPEVAARNRVRRRFVPADRHHRPAADGRVRGTVGGRWESSPGPPDLRGPYPDEVWVETGRTIPEEGAAGEAPKAKMLLWDQNPTEMR